jgi:hypothetical protein
VSYWLAHLQHLQSRRFCVQQNKTLDP